MSANPIPRLAARANSPPVHESPDAPVVCIPASVREEVQRYCDIARRKETETHLYVLGERTQDAITICAVVHAGKPIEQPGFTAPDFGAAGCELPAYIRDGYRLLGEFHRHPDGMVGPSSTDLHTISTIDADLFPGYLCLVGTNAALLGFLITAHSATADGEIRKHRVTIVPDVEVRSRLFYHPVIPAERSQAVALAGLGTLGAQVLPHLAKLNPARIDLVDHDRLEARNLGRHLATTRDVGKPKVAWAKPFLRAQGCTARIRTHEREINPGNREWMTALAQRCDVLIDATGHPIANHLLSEIGHETRTTVVGAGVFTKGSGGFVFRQDNRPGSPCYACLHHLQQRAPTDDRATMDQLTQQYGFSPEELNAKLGLFTDAGQIAAVQAKAVADVLRRDPLPSDPNLWVIDNARTIVTTHRIQQDPSCLSCHPETSVDIIDVAKGAVA